MSDALTRWEARTRIPILLTALAFVGAYAWPILDVDQPGWARSLCEAVILIAWGLLIADFCVRFGLADTKRRFLRHNWIDLVTLALPMLRPLSALRVLVALRVIGIQGREFARGKVVAFITGSIAVVAVLGAVAMLDAERGQPGALINSFGDALWWATTTVTTVGYGDLYPVTPQGRLIAAGLMLTGIALLGVITASLASWFVEKVAEVQAAEDRTEERLAETQSALVNLQASLARIESTLGSRTP